MTYRRHEIWSLPLDRGAENEPSKSRGGCASGRDDERMLDRVLLKADQFRETHAAEKLNSRRYHRSDRATCRTHPAIVRLQRRVKRAKYGGRQLSPRGYNPLRNRKRVPAVVATARDAVTGMRRLRMTASRRFGGSLHAIMLTVVLLAKCLGFQLITVPVESDLVIAVLHYRSPKTTALEGMAIDST